LTAAPEDFVFEQAAFASSSAPLRLVMASTPTRGERDRSAVLRRPDSEVSGQFRELAREWRAATGISSNLQRKVLHDAYQRIIGLGPQVVPYILDDLRNRPDHWSWALTAIVGQDHAAGATTMAAAAQAWLEWGRGLGITGD
jgi:hypothetical protein